jgi:hypothetical protein
MKLAEYIRQYFPYVLAECSNARYDMVAYLPESVPLAAKPNENEELACIHRYKRYFCDLKKREFEGNAREEAQKYNEKENELIRLNHNLMPQHDWSDHSNVMLMHQGKEYVGNQLFFAFKDKLKCCENPECEHYKEQAKNLVLWRHGPALGPGLHIFEIKSDLDVPDRLTHQIPQMMDFADYVWIVLGDKFPVPQWLPPFIGILRYGGGEWQLERTPTGPQNTPNLYSQCLHGYGLGESEIKKVSAVLHQVKKMRRAWMINAIFHFDGWQETAHGPIVDMSPYLKWADSFKVIAIESKGDKKEMQKKIETFFDSLSD